MSNPDNDPPEFRIPEEQEIQDYVDYLREPDSLDEQKLMEDDRENQVKVEETLESLFKKYENEIPWKDPEE